MKFTYRVLGAQLGVQRDSLPAGLWKKAWGLREVLFSYDDFLSEEGCVSYSRG